MPQTGIDFSNTIRNTKDFNIFTYRNFYNGGGVAIGDINNDSLPDIFFTANMGPNKLYLNKGNWQFEDVSERAGFTDKKKWSTGVVMVDINHDGWLDIYVCNAGYQEGVSNENELYINNRNMTFSDSAKSYGLAETGYTTHAAFFDYDLDGDLDAYILKNSFIPVNTLNYANSRELRAEEWPVADFLKGGGDKLLRNDNGVFRDVSKEANIFGSLIGFGLGVTVGDVNGDYFPDIYISNDFFERDYLYINQKNGQFKEALESYMQHISLSSMGADMGDINNDGFTDIFTTDMLPHDEYRLKTTTSFDNFDVQQIKIEQGFYHQFMQNTLQVNNRHGRFLETAYFSGVAASDWSWGGLIFDADNDGLSDIYVCNGIYHDVTDQDFIDFFADEIIQKMVMTGKKEEVDAVINKIPSQPVADKAFRNVGNLKFADASQQWGFTHSSFSNGAAYGDLDRDGDLDLVVSNVNEKAFIYRNRSDESSANSRYISIALRGRGKNTFAVGSVIKIFCGSEIILREVIPTRGFQSSVDYTAVIGLGDKSIDSMMIVWPDLTTTSIRSPKPNLFYTFSQPTSTPTPVLSSPSKNQKILDSVGVEFDSHREDSYVDFYHERNIPMMMSREGPEAAVGDVNGDGLEDIYVCGAAGQSGQLYLQTANGFTRKKEISFDVTAEFEDVSAVFFDCDGDKDLDLIVGSGGNHAPANSRLMQTRLYRNKGRGDFEIESTLPLNVGNTSVIAPYDYDADGDIDLFLGTRCVPNNYGISPPSYLLQNDGSGRFTDVSSSMKVNMSDLGLITSAVWVDVVGDNKKELVAVGDWMPPRLFSVEGNRLSELSSSLSEMHGWWRSVSACDVDNDGDQDLVLGNIGENFYLQPSAERPVKLWVYDFDNNGTSDKVLTRSISGNDIPVFMKRELTDQIPSLKKQNLKHKDFAKKSINELFPAEQLKQATVRTFNYPSSCVAINEGNGKFAIRKLPMLVQLSSINATTCVDLNGDGYQDLVMGGNEFGFLPQFSRLDASFGHVLINDRSGNFNWVANAESGIDLRGELRDIKLVTFRNRTHLFFFQNSMSPVLYRVSAADKLK